MKIDKRREKNEKRMKESLKKQTEECEKEQLKKGRGRKKKE